MYIYMFIDLQICMYSYHMYCWYLLVFCWHWCYWILDQLDTIFCAIYPSKVSGYGSKLSTPTSPNDWIVNTQHRLQTVVHQVFILDHFGPYPVKSHWITMCVGYLPPMPSVFVRLAYKVEPPCVQLVEQKFWISCQ